jgi:hypothetical protein
MSNQGATLSFEARDVEKRAKNIIINNDEIKRNFVSYLQEYRVPSMLENAIKR